MQRWAVPPELLSDVKNQLNITREEQAMDNKYRGLIALASTYIDGKAGQAMDYEEDGLARQLLFEYVRYARDEALDVFENNYLSLILSLQNQNKVDAYVEKAGQAQE